MSPRGSTVRGSAHITVQTPHTMLKQSTDAWSLTHKRRTVSVSDSPSACRDKARMTSLPEWPGQGLVDTDADALPLVTLPGMPASSYPKFVLPLTMYSLADMATENPHMYTQLQSADARLMALMCVATRAGCWAALNRVPEGSHSASSAAVRWSNRLSTIVTTPAVVGDGTELWRQFLASSSGFPSWAAPVSRSLAGLGQLQFLLGAALLQSTGAVYALHGMRQEACAWLKSTLAPQEVAVLQLGSEAPWTLMGAAAIGGFRASVIKQLSNDPAFVLSAHLRIAGSDSSTIRSQLESVVSRGVTAYSGFPDGDAAPVVAAARASTDDQQDDDTMSVADTLADLDFCDVEPHSGESTPRRVLDPFQEDALREALRAEAPMPPAVASLARMHVGEESIGDF